MRGHRFESHQLHLGRVFLQVSGFPSQESLHISLMARWLYPYTNHSVCIVCKTCIEKEKKKKKRKEKKKKDLVYALGAWTLVLEQLHGTAPDTNHSQFDGFLNAC